MDRRGFLRRVVGVGAGTLAAGGVVGGHLTDGEETPTVLVAGSLNHVARAVDGAAVEAHGSLAARRLVTEDARDPDALALADPRLFDGLAERVSCFASNALVVAYAPDSPAADALADDWRAVRHPGVSVGRTDPASDPLGYRTLMALQLSELDPEEVLAESSVFREVALLRTLQSGKIDAAFAYRNMAVEAGVPYVTLPPAINFADPDHAEAYAKASVELPDRTVRGAPIRYAARGFTDRGRAWVDRLTGATATLREAGFTLPREYPRVRRVASL